jgi:tyrosyl-tRNA synthetase
LERIDERSFLDVFDGVPCESVALADLEPGIGIVELLAEKTHVYPSKSEARRMIRSGGVSINKVKIVSEDEVVGANRLLKGKYLLVQKGKKNYYIIKARARPE